MEYVTDVLATFLDLGTVAVNGASESSGFHKKNLICVNEKEQRSYGFGVP